MTDETMSPAGAPAASKPAAHHARERSKTIPLEWPITFDGKTFDSVTVRRMTGNEVAEFIKRSQEGDTYLPMFDCPPEVIDALDADDSDEVNKAVMDFLPRALRQASG